MAGLSVGRAVVDTVRAACATRSDPSTSASGTFIAALPFINQVTFEVFMFLFTRLKFGNFTRFFNLRRILIGCDL